ncbi:DUF1499 domain-containing protein [Rhodobacteraceae bacterium NNCM2]|nr:DUF1499 domain-containing protein [Coraliihabitans acroporae]
MGLLASLAAAAWLWINFMPIDAGKWHVDPEIAIRPDRPNNVIAAPVGASVAAEIPSPVVASSPEDLLTRFGEIALAQPRVSEISTPGDPYRTFVQRSALMGYPDFISVKAVPVDGGAALIVYSRSQYGHSDFGVNQARVNEWLSKL